jgi:hypothetical protein
MIQNTKQLWFLLIVVGACVMGQVRAERGSAEGGGRVEVDLEGGRGEKRVANREGEYSRVLMSTNESAQVSVAFVSGTPGEKVAIVALDGGSVDGKVVKVATLNEKLQVKFRFETTENEGVYRVELRRAGGNQTLNFWAGEEPVRKGEWVNQEERH